MKKVVKGFASVILASMFVFIGCKPPTSTSKPTGQSKITVTVQGDAGVDIDAKNNTFTADKNTKWGDIKTTAKAKITVKANYDFVEWRLNSETGDLLDDNTSFTQNTTVFAVSKAKEPVTITLQGDERIDLQQTIKKPYGTKWSDIKAEIEDIETNIKPTADWKDDWNNGDYAVYEWRLGGENGEKIGDDYRFTENTTVYAVSNYAKWKIEDDGTGNKVLSGVDGSKPRGKIIIPDVVTSIGYGAFAGCSSLKSITLPKDLTSIAEKTFKGCSVLSTVNIPEGVTSIGKETFEGCSVLSTVNIPESVTSIEFAAFRYCSSLSAITIPASVTSIGVATFQDCSSLSAITIPASVISIGSYAFENCSALNSVDFADPKGWVAYKYNDYTNKMADIAESILKDKSKAADRLRDAYYRTYYWKKIK